jgi:hypothetical protein
VTSSPAARPPSTRTLDLEAAMRASVGLLVPIVVLLAMDRLDLALYASFGAFTGLYGRNERYRLRLASVGAGAGMMLVAISTGVLLSLADAPLALEAVGLAVVLGGASLVSTAMSLVPPHPLFPVFGLVVCAAVPVDGAQARDALVTAVAAILFSAGVCMSGWLLRRWAPDAQAHRFRALPRIPVRDAAVHRDPAAWTAVVANVVGALVAGAIAVALGLGHHYWAVVTLVAVLPVVRGPLSFTRVAHRVLGTLAGSVVAAGILALHLPALGVIAVAVACQFAAELAVGRHYGLALVFITPLALVMGSLGRTVPVLPLVADRVVDTVVGAAVGVVVILVLRALAARRRRRPGIAEPA